MRGGGQPLATSTIQPIFRIMIESLALNVFSNNKHGGFKVIQGWTLSTKQVQQIKCGIGLNTIIV
jgi:hypothetical protein